MVDETKHHGILNILVKFSLFGHWKTQRNLQWPRLEFVVFILYAAFEVFLSCVHNILIPLALSLVYVQPAPIGLWSANHSLCNRAVSLGTSNGEPTLNN